jgi:hypothetical protein
MVDDKDRKTHEHGGVSEYAGQAAGEYRDPHGHAPEYQPDYEPACEPQIRRGLDRMHVELKRLLGVPLGNSPLRRPL